MTGATYDTVAPKPNRRERSIISTCPTTNAPRLLLLLKLSQLYNTNTVVRQQPLLISSFFAARGVRVYSKHAGCHDFGSIPLGVAALRKDRSAVAPHVGSWSRRRRRKKAQPRAYRTKHINIRSLLIVVNQKIAQPTEPTQP